MLLPRAFVWARSCAFSRFPPKGSRVSLLLSHRSQRCFDIRCASDSTSQHSLQSENVTEHACVPHTKVEFLQKLMLQQPHPPPDARTLKVAVIGCPNAGKSSLVNMLTKWRVCAVSGKAHTTRSKQMAALTKDNVQVVFVDLPGIVNKGKMWKYNLDKSFMRDPHAAVFESDLIMVVVDASHPRSRTELDREIVKALHFFQEKESILVLNKIDKIQSQTARLLEATRRLTRGIVHNRRSHVDAYEARFTRRAKLSPSAPMIQPPSELIAAYLPAVCHIEANRLLNHLAELRAQLSPPMEPDKQVLLVGEPGPVTQTKLLLPEPSESDSTMVQNPTESTTISPQGEDRAVTETELESIDAYFKQYKMESDLADTSSSAFELAPGEDQELQQQQKQNEEPDGGGSSLTTVDELDNSPDQALHMHHLKMLNQDDVYLDAVLDALKRQLMLHSATPQEVAARRKRWLEVSIAVQGVTDWTGFSEVFMVSAANGNGIDGLRDYLFSRAVPGRPWFLSPSLVTDHEPSELIRMCVWAHCLDQLQQEVPYALNIVVDDCEKARDADDGDDRVFVHARIQCKSERHLRQVLGPNGATITEIAAAVKRELMTMFRAHTVVKLTAEMATIRPNVRHRLRKAKDFADVFPEQQRSRS